MTDREAASEPILPTATTTDRDVSDARLAVLPVGSFEQHGSYLPLATDTLIATAISDAISKYQNVFLLPPVAFGCSHEHAAFAGTVSISAATLAAVVGDVAESLSQQGVDALVVVNAHGGNYVLANVVQQANADGPLPIGLYPSREDWSEARRSAGIESSNHDDMHAGELETSILLAAHPDYLRDGWQDGDHTANDRRYLTTLGMRAYTASGVIGYPSRASAEKGHLVLDHLGKAAQTLIDVLTDPQT